MKSLHHFLRICLFPLGIFIGAATISAATLADNAWQNSSGWWNATDIPAFDNTKIAHQLSLSERTVEDHRKNIQRKTGSRNMVGIAIYAIRNKLFEVIT